MLRLQVKTKSGIPTPIIGYLDTGDFFAVAYNGGNSYETDDTNDIVLVTNTLTMEF